MPEEKRALMVGVGTIMQVVSKIFFMNQEKDDHIIRNTPSEKGRDNDTDIRDESAIQPGADTISSSNTDAANQKTTKTAADGFKTPFGADADAAFDDIGEADDNK